MPSSQASFGRVAAVLGALAVVTGAFGAHGLEDTLGEEMFDVWEVAVRYQFYHVVPLFALAVAPPSLWTNRWASRACAMWTAGIVIFSGSLYLLALSEVRWLGAITPIGGVAFILGWVFAIFAFASGRD
jgi:uncharacterized membrane protein YgdD (TMEM256/DUF423 family)